MQAESRKLKYIHRFYTSRASHWQCALVFMALICLTVSPIYAASFDCKKAATEMEKTICSDSKLSALDEDLAEVYGEIKGQLKGDTEELAQFTKSQREWLAGLTQKKDGNIACATSKECLTISYQKRIKELQTKRDLVHKKAPRAKEKIRWVHTEPGYHKFILTKGKGVEVCEAYLKRLNKTWFDRLPFCDRPENTDIPGFEKLNRVVLTAEEIYPLYYKIEGFLSGDKYFYDEWARKSESNETSKRAAIHGLEQEIGNLDLAAYRYNPTVDFDNDGVPDNLLVWKRLRCGSYEGKDPYPRRGSTDVIVLTPDSKSVDEAKTRSLIGHPIGGFSKPDGKGFYDNRFRPIGDTMGIFRFKGKTYFDTFFNSWGDFAGKRGESPDIHEILGVFKREGAQTKQVCECLWGIPYGGTFPESSEEPVD